MAIKQKYDEIESKVDAFLDKLRMSRFTGPILFAVVIGFVLMLGFCATRG